MTTILFPKTTLSVLSANTVVQNEEHKSLILGGKNAGTATSGALVTSIGVDGAESGLFGANSITAAMIRSFRANNTLTRLDAIALDDDGSGVPATGTVVFAGTATEAGTITVVIGSLINHSFEVPVADTDTATIIGDALEALITADTEVPVTAANVTGTVTLTAVNDGTEGNNIALFTSGTVAGVTTTLTAMASGAINPSLTSVFDVIADERYQTIIMPATWGTSELTTLLEARFNFNNIASQGQGFVATTDSVANLKTLADAGNERTLTIFGQKTIDTATHKGSGLIELDYAQAAKCGGIRALRLTTGTNIADIVVADAAGARDGEGGPAIASLPYANTLIANLPTIDIGNGFTQTEIESLNDSGISVIGNNKAKTDIIFGQVLTTYKTDLAGNPDESYKFLNFVDTSAQSGEYIFNNIQKILAQTRATDGDLVSRRAMVNEASIRGDIIKLKNDLTGEEFVLIRTGPAINKLFKDKLDVSLNLLTGKATVTGILPIVTQLREIVISLQLNFSID